MAKGMTLMLMGMCALPLLAGSSSERSCWLRDAASPANSVVYALCEQGGLWTTTDGGSTWTRHETGATGRARAMAFLDAKRGFVIGDRGMLLATEDGGMEWQARPIDTKEHLMDITFAGESGWIVGYQGVILHSTDGGRTWTKQKAGTTQTLETIFLLDANHGWVTGWAGTILRTSDGGQTWEKISAAAASWSLTSVYFRDTKNGWMVGFAGQILRSRDGGATWQTETSPVKSWLTAVEFDGSNRGWIAYDDGLLVSEDGGDTWKTVPVGGRFFLAKLLQVNDSMWAMGQSVMLKSDAMKWSRIESLVPGGTVPPASNTAPTRPTMP
ncbi:Glycosyl hydrolase, BNR repeat-containing protein [Candidatus Sulfopaludibacter sp. SbA6]|nr:Glycosyl hydrolase, BNR repeat-containing protein [Candidatus Sulfopaludibacter sp. SbA6]